MTYYWQFTQCRTKHHRNSLQDQEGMLSFMKLSCDAARIFLMDDQIFLPIGEVWLMLIAGTHCTLAERKEAKGQRKLLYA